MRMKQGPKKKVEVHADENAFYGVPNRPSTPINGVISNFYGDVSTKEVEDRYNQQAEAKKQLK